mgnify:CR=1 FL=1
MNKGKLFRQKNSVKYFASTNERARYLVIQFSLNSLKASPLEWIVLVFLKLRIAVNPLGRSTYKNFAIFKLFVLRAQKELRGLISQGGRA